MEVLKVGDVREFRIISMDAARKRIGLSLKGAAGRNATAQGAIRGARPASPAPERAGSQGSAPKRVVVRRAEGAKPDAKPAAQPGPEGAAPSRRPPAPRPAAGQRPGPGAPGPRREREDDGMTYNPFADLLKNRKR